MPNLTTAQILGQYRRELLAEGLSEFQVEPLVMDAARNLHRDFGDGMRVGLTVGDPDACAQCGKRTKHYHVGCAR